MKKFVYALVLVLLGLFACNSGKKSAVRHDKIIVGVFNGNGASPICVLETKEALKIDTGIVPVEVSAADIMNGKLDSIDVLVFPGGSGSKELNNLGQLGAEKVRKFVEQDGKGIVGICAGGYLLSTTPTYPSLQLISAANYDRKHYSRGRGLIEVALTAAGREIFPELAGKRVFLQYYDGPVLVANDSSNIEYTELAKYVTDIHANPGIPAGVTPGKTFMLTQQVGKGRVFVIGGHPEATPGYRWMIPRMARYVHSGQIIRYPQKWINPDIYKAEYMFTPENKKLEKQLFWNLFDDSAQVRIAAIKKLFYEMHSRPAVRWSLGLLRDKDANVRATAATILKDAEYTWAVKDLRQALKDEKDPKVREKLEDAIKFLTEFQD